MHRGAMQASPEEAFRAIVFGELRLGDVETGRMFGSEGLKVRGKVYAMLVKGKLVVKLPASRIQELMSTGAAEPFDPGHGRLMKEWASVNVQEVVRWRSLAKEARLFVGSKVGVRRPGLR